MNPDSQVGRASELGARERGAYMVLHGQHADSGTGFSDGVRVPNAFDAHEKSNDSSLTGLLRRGRVRTGSTAPMRQPTWVESNLLRGKEGARVGELVELLYGRLHEFDIRGQGT